jgi:hypothetical protein
MKIAILGTRGIPNNYGGFEQCAEYLSVGLAERGHDVTVYSPHFHPYNNDNYKGVNIIKKLSPQKIFGNSASNFIYDYICFKHAVNKDFEIILQLGLITSSLSIIFCRHKGKIITTNIDGLEWKRAKWNRFIQNLTKRLERYGIKNSDYLIADNIGIQQYIKNEYNRNSEFIPYGALKPKKENAAILDFYKMKPNRYYLSIARLEPENNLEMMCDGYLLSKSNLPYFIIGKHPTKYGDYLKDKYRNKGIIFLGAIYNKEDLDNIRYYSKLYIHGHSVGGTNPSLLEAMSAKALIASHDNKFNRSVLNKNAFYFSSTEQLSLIFNKQFHNKKEIINNNLDKINKLYRWPLIVEKYESYFKKILKV